MIDYLDVDQEFAEIVPTKTEKNTFGTSLRK